MLIVKISYTIYGVIQSLLHKGQFPMSFMEYLPYDVPPAARPAPVLRLLPCSLATIMFWCIFQLQSKLCPESILII